MNTQNNINQFLQLGGIREGISQEQKEFMQRESENNPSLLRFRHDIQEAQTQNVFQAFGDSFAKKDEKEKGLLDNVLSFLGFGEEEENPFEGLTAYNDLIPRAKINATLKEYELMQKAFAEVA